ncbi:hypothetical protein [Paenibacillus sp. CR_12]|uniref:capsular polysaccharide export protein, LipB/KpsS family n=1 Tax=Paenibacillus sp. CR_12 TaxID=3055793 RepID=UPI0035C1E4BE
MNIFFTGFGKMEFSNQIVGMPVMLKKLTDELSLRNFKCFYLYQKSNVGIEKSGKVFDSLGIQASRLPLIVNTSPPYTEFKKYDTDELEDLTYFLNEYYKLVYDKDESINNRSKVVKVLESLKYYDKEIGVDFFVVWGTALIPRIIHKYAMKNKKKVIIFENGYFRPFTLTVDNFGVNSENSLPRNPEFYEDINVSYDRYNKYLLRPEIAKIDAGLTDKFLDKLKIEKPIKNNSFSDNSKKMNLDDGDFIFVPFQLQSDAQIIRNSPNISYMKKLVEITLKAVLNYNNRNEKQKHLKIIYKPHPLQESDGKSYDIKEIMQLVGKSKVAEIAEDISTDYLIKNSKAVITINSTVGIEALVNEKPVITLGNTFYNIDGLVCNVHPDNLDRDFDDIIEFKPRKELLHKYLYFLRFNYFVECFYPDADDKSIKRVVDRMLMLNESRDQRIYETKDNSNYPSL